MANKKQLSILKQGVDAWNEWRRKDTYVMIDLMEANLSGVDLRSAYFRRANLVEANLSRANLSGASLYQANLFGADLGGANLSRANLSQANLVVADLNGSTFEDTNFTFAEMGVTRITNVDLRGCTGLDSVQHQAPSQVSTDTLILSQGKISEGFLRGCGLRDWELEGVKLYDPDLSNAAIRSVQDKIYERRATQPVQTSPLFISYSHADGRFVDKLEAQLNRKGIRFWRDIYEMTAGRIEKQIDRAITQNRTVLLVLSEHSLGSDWVEHEVRTARGLEKELKRDILCPVALDDSWKSSPWPERIMEQITEYQVLDFSKWEDDSQFESEFRKLIEGLELFYRRSGDG